jgi:hypothetical protein
VEAPALWSADGAKEATMPYLRNRFARNPYFHFHPMQSAFSLIATLVLLGMLLWVLWMSAR